jgi:hypothetical protein
VHFFAVQDKFFTQFFRNTEILEKFNNQSCEGTMRLCGIGIPFENQCAEPVAANRIHNSRLGIEKNPLVYDGADIAGTLRSVLYDAEGILRAVKNGRPVDLEGKVIDSLTVADELRVLKLDLLRIEEIVQKTLFSDEGQMRWKRSFVSMHGKELSIYKCASNLHYAADEMGKILNQRA